MSKRFIITIITLVTIAVVAGVAIFLAKGYTFSPNERRIVGTGIITISSEPDAASVFLDGHLTSATNATISSLPPKTYSVRVVKEGFIPWEKEIVVKEGLVTEVKIRLFPAIPTIYPLTFTGVENPILSPDGSKLAYVVPVRSTLGETNRKGGVWVWTLSRNQPIAFARSAEPHRIAESTLIDFSEGLLRWSPDSKQVLATVGNNNYLLESDSLNTNPRDITPILSSTERSWQEDIKNNETARILAIKDMNLQKIASGSAELHWSPDETKFMARLPDGQAKNAEDESFKVYDLETKKDYNLPPARLHLWLPDSRHIIMVEEGIISLIEFDGTNKAVFYAGNFLNNFVFPWPDSSRLVILSTFPTPTASEPNLYGINLR